MKKILMVASIALFLASPLALAQDDAVATGSAAGSDNASGLSQTTLGAIGFGAVVVGAIVASGDDDGDTGFEGGTGTGPTGTGPTGTGPTGTGPSGT